MAIAKWKEKRSKFCQLDVADKWLLFRAVAWLAAARIMLGVLPFRSLATRMSASSDSAQFQPDPELLQRIGRSVAIAANHVPWRSDCIPQTIAARMLLKSHGYTSIIHIGVERVGDDELIGHAWLTCGETIVTGNTDLHRYKELHHPNT